LAWASALPRVGPGRADVRAFFNFIVLDDAQVAAGMLLGMLAFQPQRAVMFGHKKPPTRQEIEARAKACATLFLQGVPSLNLRDYPKRMLNQAPSARQS
jgi:hypothetical protein